MFFQLSYNRILNTIIPFLIKMCTNALPLYPLLNLPISNRTAFMIVKTDCWLFPKRCDGTSNIICFTFLTHNKVNHPFQVTIKWEIYSIFHKPHFFIPYNFLDCKLLILYIYIKYIRIYIIGIIWVMATKTIFHACDMHLADVKIHYIFIKSIYLFSI